MEEPVVIDQTNFSNYFFDVRRHKPKHGQILAKFTAVAVFGSGYEKRDIIKLLKMDKAFQAAQVMEKIHLAKAPDCYRLLREMCQDLLSGMTDDEVDAKEYEFTLEAVYYTKKEYVPKHDPHWETLQILQYDAEKGRFISTIEL